MITVIRFEGFLVAVMALMETPAIISGLLLARKHRVQPFELAELQQRLLQELEGLNADDEAVDPEEEPADPLAEDTAKPAGAPAADADKKAKKPA